MNLNVMHTYSLDVIEAFQNAVTANDARQVSEAFTMYKECMVLALEHGHFGVSNALADRMYQVIKFESLVERRLTGKMAPEVFSTIISRMPPLQQDMYAKNSSDEIHSELLTQFLRQTVKDPNSLQYLFRHACVHGFPNAFCIGLQALLTHPNQKAVIALQSGQSVISLVQEYITPEYIYVDGEQERAPKGTQRQLPQQAVELLREHHELLAAIHQRLGSYAAADSFTLDVIEQFAVGLPEESLKRFISHHAHESKDPRFLCRRHALGLPGDPQQIMDYIKARADANDYQRYSQVSMQRGFCFLIESPAVEVGAFGQWLAGIDGEFGRATMMLDAMAATLRFTANNISGPSPDIIEKVETICFHLLAVETDNELMRSHILKIPHLPKRIAQHDEFIETALQIDVGL
jgi:hypothetical protein